MNLVPTPSVLWTSISPPSFWTIPYVMESPSPVPAPFFVEKKGSKIWERCSSGIPTPSSWIQTETASGSASRIPIWIRPPSSMAAKALLMMFRKTC